MHVPSYYEAVSMPEQFETADGLLREELGRLYNKGEIYGAFLYGSVSFADAAPGSDRDLIVAYNGPAHLKELKVLPQLHTLARKIYVETNVPLEVTCGTLQQFKDGEHLFPNTMLDWLRTQTAVNPQDMIGHKFMHTITRQRWPNEAHTDFTELSLWVAKTHATLQKQYLQGYYSDKNWLLGQVFGAPRVAVRKMVDTLQRNGFGTGEKLTDLTKDGVEKSLFDMYEGGLLLELYTDITTDACAFSNKFLPQVKDLTPEEYDQIVEATIEENLPKAIHLLTRVQLAHRCARAHLRLLMEEDEYGKTVRRPSPGCGWENMFSIGPETEALQPFLPEDLLRTLMPS